MSIDAEALARLRDHTIDFDGSPMPLLAETFPITCGELIALLDIAEAVARAPVVEVEPHDIIGGDCPMVTMPQRFKIGQRVRVVPCNGGGE